MDKGERVEWLKGLENEVETILQELQKDKQNIDGSINWADLHCVEAKWVIDQDGEERAEVLIEEVSPYEVVLGDRVRENLKDRGYGFVDIHLEW